MTLQDTPTIKILGAVISVLVALQAVTLTGLCHVMLLGGTLQPE